MIKLKLTQVTRCGPRRKASSQKAEKQFATKNKQLLPKCTGDNGTDNSVVISGHLPVMKFGGTANAPV